MFLSLSQGSEINSCKNCAIGDKSTKFSTFDQKDMLFHIGYSAKTNLVKIQNGGQNYKNTWLLYQIRLGTVSNMKEHTFNVICTKFGAFITYCAIFMNIYRNLPHYIIMGGVFFYCNSRNLKELAVIIFHLGILFGVVRWNWYAALYISIYLLKEESKHKEKKKLFWHFAF